MPDGPIAHQTELVSYGPLVVAAGELHQVAERTYRAKLANVSPGVPRVEGDLHALRRFESAFAANDSASSLYALWHWAGGIPASVGDLRLTTLWVRGLHQAAIELSIDWESVDSALEGVSAQIAEAMRGTGDVAVAAASLAQLLDNLADEVSEFVLYDAETGEFSGVREVLPLLGWLEKFYQAFSSGPDENGRFLPDDCVWDCLAGSAPHAL